MPISEILGSNGYAGPKLNVLLPTVDNYKALLIQPRGHIEASSAGVRNRDRSLAARQFKQFLAAAAEQQADLAIAPEYSTPWEVLAHAVGTGVRPGEGRLWALGCESIRYAELATIKQELAQQGIAVLYEHLEADPAKFVDPLAYVFMTPTSVEPAAPHALVIVVQFKTQAMGDPDHFEIANLQRGNHVYALSSGQSIRLVSLICSDAFAFTDAEASEVYDRSLVVHIQLNPKPRQEQYRRYRERLLQYNGDETELICLNWACNVEEWSGTTSKPWKNIAGSAWYLRPEGFDQRDHVLCANHRRGLYYTWVPSLRSHALFFNYEPAMFVLEATKVVHVGVPKSLSRRRGPQLAAIYFWDDQSEAWTSRPGAEDGFASIVGEAGGAKNDIVHAAQSNIFAAERLLALCAGSIADPDWFALHRLDSCIIQATEVVQRLTFCQDTDDQAQSFRVARVRRCASLWSILKDGTLPPALAGLKQGFRLEWDQ